MVLTFRDGEGRPLPNQTVLLRRDGVVLPQEALAQHLGAFGLPAASDGGGRLALVGLAPGAYDVFLAGGSSAASVAAGLPHGFLTSAPLAPLTTTELEVSPEEP